MILLRKTVAFLTLTYGLQKLVQTLKWITMEFLTCQTYWCYWSIQSGIGLEHVIQQYVSKPEAFKCIPKLSSHKIFIMPCHWPEVLHFFIAGKYQKYQHQQTDDINQRCPLFENSHQRNVFHRSQMTNSLRCPTKWWMLNWKWLISLQTLMLGLKRLQKPLIPY